MKLRGLLAFACLLACAVRVDAVDLRNRSDSTSRQFAVYCDDIALRQHIATFAEEVKADVLQLLGESDRWKSPIVITLDHAIPGVSSSPVALRCVQTDGGFKVDISVNLEGQYSSVNLQKQIVRALLLEYAYRERGVEPGQPLVEAPWWIVEGAIEIFRRRDFGVDTRLFKRLVEQNQIPTIAEFLPGTPDDLGFAARAVDRACAMALVELLVEQPGGRDSLARLVREWPAGNRDPLTALKSAFPTLATGQTVQKWWTVSVARMAASDRHEGMSVSETDRELRAQLALDLPTGKGDTRRSFKLLEYRVYLKLPGARDALLARQSALVALSARANALLRPLVAEYEQIVGLLARGKTRGIEERLAAAEQRRESVLRQLSGIEDYLNWFEATQMGLRSDAFDEYLRTANEVKERDLRATDAISRYLNILEREFTD